MNADEKHPIVLAITGASGAVYAARLLQLLLHSKRLVHLVVSDSGTAVIGQELGVAFSSRDPSRAPEALKELLAGFDQRMSQSPELSGETVEQARNGYLQMHRQDDYFTPIASGSYLTAGMVVCPCSGSTLSGIAHSASQNLIQRAAEVHLKEHRKLIVVPRETPLSVLMIENMHRLAQAGVVVLPASPGWYHGATSMLDLVDFVAARVLDQLGIANQQIARWGE